MSSESPAHPPVSEAESLAAAHEPLAAQATTLLKGWREAAVRAALLAVAGLVFAGWLFLAIAHLHDRYGQEAYFEGRWVGLAQYANEGVLYPPLYDGDHYGGTKYMPVPILVNAAAARVTGEYLTSGKLVAVLSMALLLVIVFVLLRRFRSPLPLAATLTAGIVATETGRVAGTALGGDVVPVVLQLGALMAATSNRRRSLVASGALAGLALASKTTGVWAALAILTWLSLHRRWRDLATFGGAFTIMAALLFAAVQVASHGRFTENLAVLSSAGVGGGAGPIRVPNQLIRYLTSSGGAVWALMPFAFLGAIASPGWRRLGPWYLALGWAFLLLLVIYTDVGATFNHLLDVIVLGVLGVGHLAGRLNRNAAMTAPLAVALTVAVLWAVGSGAVPTLVPDIRRTLAHEQLGYPVKPLRNVIRPGDEMLSDDAYVDVSFGRNPVVMDPYMLLYLDRVDPAIVDPLIARIEHKEFDYVVLRDSLDRSNDYWWATYDFGPRVVEALRRAYLLGGVIDSYFVYRPAP